MKKHTKSDKMVINGAKKLDWRSISMGTNTFYTNQVITYLGNKRSLLREIENIVIRIILEDYKSISRESIISADLFSGSGVVARMLKTYSGKMIVNDFEPYSKIINECYLTNKDDFNDEKYDEYYEKIRSYPIVNDGIIRKYYSPLNDQSITKEDRCFYTNQNALLIDTYRRAISELVHPNMQKFFLAPLLYEASVHVNTGGMFKGFYKDKNTGVGKFGGTNADSLKRILGEIKLSKPILSDYDSDVCVYCEDTNELVKKLREIIDIAYIDSPYNEHPYGSNYFMLNTILTNKIVDPSLLSKVSGIPKNWKKSDYYKKQTAYNAMYDLILNLKAKWIILSYSSDGIITYDEMLSILNQFGHLTSKEISYSVLKSSRNRKNNKNHVKEYIFVLKKKLGG